MATTTVSPSGSAVQILDYDRRDLRQVHGKRSAKRREANWRPTRAADKMGRARSPQPGSASARRFASCVFPRRASRAAADEIHGWTSGPITSTFYSPRAPTASSRPDYIEHRFAPAPMGEVRDLLLRRRQRSRDALLLDNWESVPPGRSPPAPSRLPRCARRAAPPTLVGLVPPHELVLRAEVRGESRASALLNRGLCVRHFRLVSAKG